MGTREIIDQHHTRTIIQPYIRGGRAEEGARGHKATLETQLSDIWTFSFKIVDDTSLGLSVGGLDLSRPLFSVKKL